LYPTPSPTNVDILLNESETESTSADTMLIPDDLVLNSDVYRTLRELGQTWRCASWADSESPV